MDRRTLSKRPLAVSGSGSRDVAQGTPTERQRRAHRSSRGQRGFERARWVGTRPKIAGMTEPRQEKLHSADYSGPERDYWWNRDYLELVAARLELGSVRSVLDGLRRWSLGTAVASILPSDATIVGVDREPEWVERAAQSAATRGIGRRLHYVQGHAEELRFEEGSFDLVTCQTLLMHVATPRIVIREMLRVTTPRGLMLVAEPHNRAQLLIETSVDAEASVEELLERMRFVLMFERGQMALGEGNSSIGDLLPGYLAAAA
jgi:SAM-dependent methyltransferase